VVGIAKLSRRGRTRTRGVEDPSSLLRRRTRGLPLELVADLDLEGVGSTRRLAEAGFVYVPARDVVVGSLLVIGRHDVAGLPAGFEYVEVGANMVVRERRLLCFVSGGDVVVPAESLLWVRLPLLHSK
jgi:hypothetical protein